MIRPQKTISSEVNLIFRSDTHHTTEHTNFLRMCNWLKNNNLDQYVDMTNPHNCAIGQPLLGTLLGTYGPADINRILSLGQVGAARLL
jgi:hypothetical protein